MQFRLLGPVEITVGGQLLPLPRRQDRCLLGVLLLEANRMVPISRLTDLLWDGHPPGGARRSLHGQVSRLRAIFAAGGQAAPTLVSLGEGYRLDVEPQAVDVFQFRELVRTALGSDLEHRIKLTRAALELWRGPVLGNAASADLRDRLCAGLEEERLAAVENLLSASLALRQEREVLPELTQLAMTHPGRESLAALLMRGLYQADRKTDALTVFATTSGYLATELGIDPGPRLRELHEAILRDELEIPALPVAEGETGAVPPSAAPASPPAPTTPLASLEIPRQLPPVVVGFAGRKQELARLDALLAAAELAAATVVVVVSGTAGVGKSALTVHWAHQVRHRFPDGQLYVNLRAPVPGEGVSPAEALVGFLRALGVPSEGAPSSLADLAADYRSAVAGRRMLIILDNAIGIEQVQPLLPGSPGCLVVVTSRHQLGGLVASYGAHWVKLDVLPPAEAYAVLERALGLGRVEAEPESTAELARLCGHLPLALRIAAANLTVRPCQRIADQVAVLRRPDRFAALAVSGDPEHSLAAAFDLSYLRLPTPAQRLFRLLGLCLAPEVTAETAAALAGLAPPVASELLQTLHQEHLLDEPEPGRYTCAELWRGYAASRAAEEEPSVDRQAATEPSTCRVPGSAPVPDQPSDPRCPARPRISSGPIPCQLRPNSDYLVPLGL